ncbi:MAG: dienelactone hydrolase family protein [Rhizobiaceae bacterium]|nr:dienelactone hydrolase family protein [Rhizobiaceae bacterium]
MSKRAIEIATADGKAAADLFSPGTKSARPETRQAGVILYMDAFGPRPALDEMAARMAAFGYHVLVPDLFYREAPYGPFDAKTAFANAETATALRSLIGRTTQEMTIRDSTAFLQALADQGATGPIGTVGYCMGGARALNAAASFPGRVVAAASFHGGNLASDAADSPHLRVGDIKARVYVGSAGIDRSFPPEQSARLESALRTAEVDFVMENYVGLQHGWCVPDSNVFDAAGAGRHWSRLETFFRETLG